MVMKRRALTTLITTALGLALAACGPASKPGSRTAPPEIVPLQIGETGWVRSPKLDRFAGDSLFEYIDGAAEMYHKYDFLEVTVAKYLKGENTITSDLYLFEGPDLAFGMYTTLRPDEPDTVTLGVSGFSFGPNLVFVKGSHLVNAYTYDEFDGAVAAVRSVSAALEARLPGTSEKPSMFDLFPDRDRVDFSEKIYAEGFLGHGFLTDVYSVDYAVGEARVRLFITPDPEAAKADRWLEGADVEPDRKQSWKDEIFEETKSLQIVHDYHGEIVAGWRAGKLVGIVGYVPAYREALIDWVGSIE
jgi:hypothetical protein